MAWGALGGDGYRSRRRSQLSRTSQPGSDTGQLRGAAIGVSYTKTGGYPLFGVAARLRHEPFALAEPFKNCSALGEEQVGQFVWIHLVDAGEAGFDGAGHLAG